VVAVGRRGKDDRKTKYISPVSIHKETNEASIHHGVCTTSHFRARKDQDIRLSIWLTDAAFMERIYWTRSLLFSCRLSGKTLPTSVAAADISLFSLCVHIKQVEPAYLS
jgi:hypothetical protein